MRRGAEKVEFFGKFVFCRNFDQSRRNCKGIIEQTMEPQRGGLKRKEGRKHGR